MKKGPLNRRVTLLREANGEDAYGDVQSGFAELATVWASVRPSPGTERLVSAEAAANAPTVVRIIWNPRYADLNPKDQLEYPVGSGRRFDIKSVIELGRREGLEIAAIGRPDQ